MQSIQKAKWEKKKRKGMSTKGLFGEKKGMEWNGDLNPGGLGMELEF